MTQDDIRLWLRDLPIQVNMNSYYVTRPCENDAERIRVVNYLLNHAKEDGMSQEDKAICKRALVDLGAPYVEKKRRWTRRSPSSLRVMPKTVDESLPTEHDTMTPEATT